MDKGKKKCAPNKTAYPNRTDRMDPAEDMPEEKPADEFDYLPDVLPSRRER